MEIKNAEDFLEDVMYDDIHASQCLEWYKDNACLTLAQWELKELHTALSEWVEQNNIVRVQTVAGINNDIRLFLEETRNDEGGR